jgi:hypothetical protein
MSKTRSEILTKAREVGRVWSGATAQSTKNRMRESQTELWTALEELSRLTTKGEER